MSGRWEVLRHMTWRGRVETICDWMRGLVIAPAPSSERCFMGAPVAPEVQCPRFALPDALWCKRHARPIPSSTTSRGESE